MLYLGIQRKVWASTIGTSVASRQETPQDVTVSASIYGCCLIRQTLEATDSFLGKG